MKGLCPACGRLVEAEEVTDAGHVVLVKRCPEHGESRMLLSADATYWNWSLRYNRPGTAPFKWSSEVKDGCPNDCGICPSHKQHSCVCIIEITESCNLRCPICFADTPSGGHLPLEQVTSMIDAFVSYETNPEILQISGGEPTTHPDIIDIIKYAKGFGIEDVVVSTNGLKLSDEDFMNEFSKEDPVVYLQFDTFDPAISQRIRGHDLVEKKMQAVDACNEHGITVVLVPTLVRGLNDHEIGRIIEYGIHQQRVFGVNFQPLAMTGRVGLPGAESLTIDEVLRKIEEQTSGIHKARDFRPIPCPHPHCTAISYVLVDGDEVVPLTEIVNVDDYIDYAKDRTLVSKSTLLDNTFDSLFSTSAIPGTERTISAFCEACGISVPEFLGKSVKTISVHAFMDVGKYQIERVQKCCIHLIQPDGKMIPFCNYNMFHRHKSGDIFEKPTN